MRQISPEEFADIIVSKINGTANSPHPSSQVNKQNSPFTCNLVVDMGGGMQQMQLYNYQHYYCSIELQNNGSKTISDFVVEIHVPKLAIQDWHSQKVIKEKVIYSQNFNQKFYPTQLIRTEKFQVTISARIIRDILDKEIEVKIFSDFGVEISLYKLSDFFTLTDRYNNNVPIALELFLDPRYL